MTNKRTKYVIKVGKELLSTKQSTEFVRQVT